MSAIPSVRQFRLSRIRGSRCRTSHQTAIGRDVIACHAPGCEALLETSSNCTAAEDRQPAQSEQRFLFVMDDEPGQPVFDNFRCSSAVEGNDRSPARHGFNEDEAEWLGPCNRCQEGNGAAEKARLFA